VAAVDNDLPASSTPMIVAGFDDAVVAWTTSEPTDALVQFGESSLLGRTAFVPDLQTNHEVRLSRLQPDHTYFFQIVSRDPAGNTVVDDNHHQFYVFRTRFPLQPPFSDDCEGNGTNWTVLNGSDSPARWRLGSPNNGVETMAHSPLSCWGSSLLGESFQTADTYLTSPAIELSGGNVASLHFWQRYDFTRKTSFDYQQFGELLIITNSLSDPIRLAQYTNANSGWEEQTVDLTPYVGRVVFLVWHHYLLSFANTIRAGWLVDDIEVSVTNVPPGTIQITNNLAQARYVLSGPMTRTGQGWETVITNATPGRYAVTYSTVPYFHTPPSQTNIVASDGVATFYGFYTFTDANTNGISDAWEQQFFGGVSSSRTRYTDTDGDGFPDYAEFIAGTNPTLPNSYLRLANPVRQVDGSIRLQWPSVDGRVYQVQGTTNFSTWVPLTGWLQATGGTTTAIVPAASINHQEYRVEVRP
jgi:hypothetical protein